ncbi:unnamed protein product [Zymoseptoria tritici ST99CH_1A5]|uniref:C2H2-type domain-containing protein n=2 Tax=Zymoseptoria tritici TaxID=1047171 RepID=A0A1Y6L2V6_ZYMTR|nr:unnamed protein product [Zymoseptoria tritici ST99CH_3D1]SMY18717.1 unnamed protein product [Zymoseptoria tritici ST99CH_1A5]
MMPSNAAGCLLHVHPLQRTESPSVGRRNGGFGGVGRRALTGYDSNLRGPCWIDRPSDTRMQDLALIPCCRRPNGQWSEYLIPVSSLLLWCCQILDQPSTSLRPRHFYLDHAAHHSPRRTISTQQGERTYYHTEVAVTLRLHIAALPISPSDSNNHHARHVTPVTMVKRKHDWEPLEVRLAKTFCYYCDREFNDEKELTDHQKAKHFRCSQCNRRLNTVGGLYVHLEQVHKIKLTEVPNCTIEGRGMVVREQEIYGMVGVPEHLIKARIAEITQAFYSEEAEYRAKTGNSLDTGNVVAPEIKKQKKEEDMKKGVANAKEVIARRKAAQAAAKAAAEAGHPPPSASPGVPSNTEEATAAPYTPPTAMQAPVTMQHNNGQPAPFNHNSQYTPPQHMYQPAYHNGGMQAHTPNAYHNGMQAHNPNVYHNGMQAQAPPGISMYGAASPYNSSFSHQNAAVPRMAHGPPHTTTLPPAQHHGLPPRPTSGYQLYPTAPTQASGASLPQKMAKLPTPVSAAPKQDDTAVASPGSQGREVAAVAEIALAAPETAIEAPAPARAPGLVMAINDEPWEERRARAPRYLERVRQFLGI